jgi:hypothetical protein
MSHKRQRSWYYSQPDALRAAIMCLLVLLIAGTSQTGTPTSNRSKQGIGQEHDHSFTPYTMHSYADVIQANTICNSKHCTPDFQHPNESRTHNHQHGDVHNSVGKANSGSFHARWSNYRSGYLLSTSITTNENNNVTHSTHNHQHGDVHNRARWGTCRRIHRYLLSTSRTATENNKCTHTVTQDHIQHYFTAENWDHGTIVCNGPRIGHCNSWTTITSSLPGDHPTSISVDQDVTSGFDNLHEGNAYGDAVYAMLTLLTNQWTLRMSVYRSDSIFAEGITHESCYSLLWAFGGNTIEYG